MILVSHPTGNANVRALLLGLENAGLLAGFRTSIDAGAGPRLVRCLPKGLRDELERRTFPIPSHKIGSRPLLELCRISSGRLGWKWPTRHETGWASVDAIYRSNDKSVARSLGGLKGARAVYAYEDGALETFRRALALSMMTVYDLPIVYWEVARSLNCEEAQRLPAWSITLPGNRESTAKYERKTEEMLLSDVVVCPSDFVARSLPRQLPRAPAVVVAPFGSPCPSPPRPPRYPNRRGLRVLFAGSMSQRKGLGDLFAAMKLLDRPDVELVVMGSPVAPMAFYRRELPGFIHEPPRPHQAVLQLMRSCDVLVLPSIIEGRALVMQEAMSQGLPVIITPNTGGEDLVEEGRTGFLVPIRSPRAIAERLDWFADSPEETQHMGQLAQRKAEGYRWDNYGALISRSLKEQLAARRPIGHPER